MAAICFLGGVLLFLLKQYSTEMVHAVVQNAVIQKAPPGYSEEKIRQAFDRRLMHSRTSEEKDIYLRELKTLAQFLEKLQTLEEWQVDQIVDEIAP